MDTPARVDEADSSERVRSAAAKSDRLSDSLHRGLTASGTPDARCWLLLDLSPLGMQEPDEPALAELLSQTALCRIEPRRVGVPTEMAPALLPLNADTAADSALLRSSLELALHELPSARLAQGGGRVIATWLECDGEPQAAQTALRRHIAHTMFARRASGRIEWLRWYDPAVLWVLWPRLSVEQQRLLLGPVRRCWLLAPSGTLQCLSPTTVLSPQAATAMAAATGPIEFTATQWAAIDAIGALNLALVQANASEFDDAGLMRARDAGMSALARAQRAGFMDREDLAVYACRAMTCHPVFDEHTEVAQRLNALKPGDYFSACIDDLTEADWLRICRELDERRGKPLT